MLTFVWLFFLLRISFHGKIDSDYYSEHGANDGQAYNSVHVDYTRTYATVGEDYGPSFRRPSVDPCRNADSLASRHSDSVGRLFQRRPCPCPSPSFGGWCHQQGGGVGGACRREGAAGNGRNDLNGRCHIPYSRRRGGRRWRPSPSGRWCGAVIFTGTRIKFNTQRRQFYFLDGCHTVFLSLVWRAFLYSYGSVQSQKRLAGRKGMKLYINKATIRQLCVYWMFILSEGWISVSGYPEGSIPCIIKLSLSLYLFADCLFAPGSLNQRKYTLNTLNYIPFPFEWHQLGIHLL